MYISDVTIVFHNHVLFDLYATILLGCITCTGVSECIDVAYCYRCSVVCGCVCLLVTTMSCADN